MSQAARKTPDAPMNVADYLAWYEQRPDGARYELHDGIPVEMQAERVTHSESKLAAAIGLRSAIQAAGRPCHVLIDGPQVVIREEDTAYQPDVVVYCGDKVTDDRLIVPDPVIVVEVSSPSTDAMDGGLKLSDYFDVPSIAHYLRVLRDRNLVLHYERNGDATLRARFLQAEDTLSLDPPGITLQAGALIALPD